jgi:2-hydroxy-6-oxonona-2,4-dienedioate hydrolase
MSIWTAYLGAEARFADAGGVSTRYVSLGDGPVLLFLHGRGGHLETFVRNAPVLATRFRTISVDLLGHGMTAQTSAGDYSIMALTGHLERFLDTIGVRHAHVVGQSLGGWVAAWLALGRPQRIGKLVLIEPQGLQSEEERLAAPGATERYRAGGEAYENPSHAAVRKRLTGLVADPDLIDDEMVETRWRLYQPEAARDVHQRVRRADNGGALLSPDRLATLAHPTLFIRGEHGHTPVPIVEASARACANARVLTVPDTKQWPQYERPDLVNAAMTDFLLDRR